jgi:hypothetical protein
MGMAALRYATALLGLRGQCIALDQTDLLEMIGKNAGGQKSGYASTYYNCVFPLCTQRPVHVCPPIPPIA